MKKIGFSVLGIFMLFLIMGLISQGDWHLKRNKQNKLPTGKLTQVEGKIYLDEHALKWILQPNSRNVFHQPDKTPVSGPSIPYPNVSPPLNYDPDYPNLKFLSPDEQGGSYEAILKPDGLFLITGKKQGTYNYSDPSDFIGYMKHVLMDVIPHFFSSDYDDSLNKPELLR
ncbi:MAG: hypothetical protein DRI89_01295 [Bacteroidetes bacterium]|nr:MAG: hypothetical protein DRI89_01295 [Bacteroidota bacterium]